MKRILVAGASIGGPTVAWWLHRFGFDVTLVERMDGPARGGHAIDVRGTAVTVLEAMGLADATRDNAMRMKGVSIIDQSGQEVWRSEEMTISGGRFGNVDIEILRDRLAHVLVGGLPSQVPIIYGDSIAAMHETDDAVEVTFASGRKDVFDIVIGADGLRSQTRRMRFGEDQEFLHSFDIAFAPFSAPNSLGLADWQISYKGLGGGYMVYTTPENDSLRVCFNVPASLDDDLGEREAQIERVRRECADLGWETPQFLEAMAVAPDFYLGLVAQVRMDRWSRGRVALVGDSGYCPSPYSGQGATLAIVGAYVLAAELAAADGDHLTAFDRYETRMRPFVDANQAIVKLTRDPRFESDPDYYMDVIEPAMDRAKFAIDMGGLELTADAAC